MSETVATEVIEDVSEIEAFASSELTSDKEKQMAARSDMYALLADVFRYPDADFRKFVRNEELQQAISAIAERLPFAFSLTEWEMENLGFSSELTDDDVEAEFIRLFEAGPGDPPCPLVEGKHIKDTNRRTIFEDLIRFYNNFGLSYAEGSHEDRPDHVAYEMEFMHYLCFLTLRAIQNNQETDGLLLAQKDFLSRHLVKWAPLLVKTIDAIAREVDHDKGVLFYANLMNLLDRYIQADWNHLNG
ncbi:MAG: molecular chaperone TorD family protein [Thermodesulfobacteriota bacterium]|nr:molecular chaperone TorD family protein [Thermodesulfobacteriota bacterium]